jgi:sugar phosphate permease
VCSGAFFIAVSQTRSLGYFYVVYGLLAIANCGVGIIPVSSVLARWFNKRRGTAVGLAMVGISVGGFVITPLVGLITERFSWQASFLVLGLLVWLVALPAILFVIRANPEEMGLTPDGREPDGPGSNLPGGGSSTDPGGWPLRAALRTRAFWGVAATFFLSPMALMGVLQHQVPLLVEAGLSQSVSALAMGVTAGMGGLGKVGFGRIAELVPIRYAATVCFALQAVAVLLILGDPAPALIWVYVLLFGISMGGVIVLIPLSVGHFFGLRSFGVILGVLMLLQALGNSVGAYSSGLIHDHFGSYQRALVLFLWVYLAAIAAIWSAGRPQTYRAEGG